MNAPRIFERTKPLSTKHEEEGEGEEGGWVGGIGEGYVYVFFVYVHVLKKKIRRETSMRILKYEGEEKKRDWQQDK